MSDTRLAASAETYEADIFPPHAAPADMSEWAVGAAKGAGRWHGIIRRTGEVCRAALDMALPPLCAACRVPLGSRGCLCPDCWSQVSFIAPPYCGRLGIPFPYDPGPGILSLEAIADPPAYNRSRAAVRYDDIAKDLVHRLKYGDRLDLAAAMGRWMAQAGGDILADADALVPVPLHWGRLWNRRFNQSALLARAVVSTRPAGRNIPILLTALTRAKATPQQVGLSRPDRAANVRGAFAVPAAGKIAIRGKRLILVDDVLTSGATLEACAKALLRAGAGNVDVLVFARVVAAARPPI